MREIQELQSELDTLTDEMSRLANADLDDAGRRRFDALEAKAKRINQDIRRMVSVDDLKRESRAPVGRPPTPALVRGEIDAPNWSTRTNTGGEYRSLFPRADFSSNAGFRSFAEFLSTVSSGRSDPRLNERAMGGAISSDGGFALSPVHTAMLSEELFSNSIVLQMGVRRIGMTSREVSIPAWATSDMSAGGVGGLTAGWTQELAAATESSAKLREIVLSARRLSIFTGVSRELLEDAVNGFEADLISAFGKTLAHYADDAWIDGDGSGKPKGLLRGAALITVAKETDQDAASILWENLVNCYARMLPGSQRRCVWLASPTVVPQLMSLGLSVGAGGEWYRVLNEENGRFTVMGLPVYFSSHCPVLGQQGDINLIDPMSYIVGVLGDSLRVQASEHYRFPQYQTCFLSSLRADGASAYNSVITGADGVTVAPVCNVAVRA